MIVQVRPCVSDVIFGVATAGTLRPIATNKVEASAPVVHPKSACLGLWDHFDIASEVLAHTVPNSGIDPLTNDQNCGWGTPAYHLADMGFPARLEDIVVSSADGQLGAIVIQFGAIVIKGGDTRIDQPNTGALHFLKQV